MKKLEKQRKNNPKTNRIKEMIKIWKEVYQIKTKRAVNMINKELVIWENQQNRFLLAKLI